jgi:WhiB family transcriptional regulator, redox-sensing transcriptional regulator
MRGRRAGAAIFRHKRRILLRPAPSWMERAACAGHDDPDLWFPERGEDERRQQALAICAACPVRPACLAYVLSMPPQPGIWGGTTEDERRQADRHAAERPAWAARPVRRAAARTAHDHKWAIPGGGVTEAGR